MTFIGKSIQTHFEWLCTVTIKITVNVKSKFLHEWNHLYSKINDFQWQALNVRFRDVVCSLRWKWTVKCPSLFSILSFIIFYHLQLSTLKVNSEEFLPTIQWLYFYVAVKICLWLTSEKFTDCRQYWQKICFLTWTILAAFWRKHKIFALPRTVATRSRRDVKKYSGWGLMWERFWRFMRVKNIQQRCCCKLCVESSFQQ